MSRKALLIAAAAVAVAVPPAESSPGQNSYTVQTADLKPALPGALQGVGIDQRLNQSVPLNLVFKDESARAAPLSTYFHDRPVLLALVYYQCPMLCTRILNGVVDSLNKVPFTPGRDFEVLSVSFDPKDTPELAAAKKKTYLAHYGHQGTQAGWHFLTGDASNIQALTRAVGFHYRYDPASGQFAHASAIMLLTPGGRLSRYFYGVEYAPKDVRLGLVEASHEKIGSAIDQILLFCYHYDASTGKYGAMAMNTERLGGAVFLLLAGSGLFVLLRRDRRASRQPWRHAG
jgi:protein SCO1/2